jgi:hypothetical protein
VCQIDNHGPVNLSDVFWEYLWFESATQRFYASRVFISHLDKGKPFRFYILNRCSVDIGIRFRGVATAIPVGEGNSQEFVLEREGPESNQNYGLASANPELINCNPDPPR